MQQVFLTIDLGFGDSGKGSIVDFLTRQHRAHTVVRYNGGAQAGHRVVTDGPQPQEHVFAQFGSGTLAGAATHLSQYMLLDPLAMVEEERHLCAIGVADAFERTSIDARALVITPFGRAINRLRELARGAGRHGSCGMGVGETMADFLAHGQQVLFAGDLADNDRLHRKLTFLRSASLAKLQHFRAQLPDTPQVAQELDMLEAPDVLDWLHDAYGTFVGRAQIVAGDHLTRILAQPGAVVFEAAQGVLLDEWRGFHPHTTWSTTTLANAHALLAEANYSGQVRRLGITRAYTTRHGAGPLVTEDAELAHALPDARNGVGDWQGSFRVGWLDLVMLRYALEVAGPLDGLALTCLDRLAALPQPQICRRYRCGTFELDRIVPAPSAYDLDYQERITNRLAECQPVLEPLVAPTALLDLLPTALGLPIEIISEGPTAAQKHQR